MGLKMLFRTNVAFQRFFFLSAIMSPSATAEMSMNTAPTSIPKTQTVALVTEFGGKVEFKDDYPVPTAKHNEVLAKILYTGVCQSGKLHGVFQFYTHYATHLLEGNKLTHSSQTSTPNSAKQ